MANGIYSSGFKFSSIKANENNYAFKETIPNNTFKYERYIKYGGEDYRSIDSNKHSKFYNRY